MLKSASGLTFEKYNLLLHILAPKESNFLPSGKKQTEGQLVHDSLRMALAGYLEYSETKHIVDDTLQQVIRH